MKKLKENTLAAFKYSFKKGYGIETDIHCTKDNKIICFHDFNLKNKFKVNRKSKIFRIWRIVVLKSNRLCN